MKRCVYCTGRVEDGESDTCEVCQKMNRAYVDLDEILCAAVNDGAIDVHAIEPLRTEIESELKRNARIDT